MKWLWGNRRLTMESARETFLSNMKIISCVRFELDFHPKKEHSRSYVTDEGGNMERKDFQR